MEPLLFLLGVAIIANMVYGLVLWSRTMTPGRQRTMNIVLACLVFHGTAAVMLGYVPWRLWKNAQLAKVAP